MCECAKSSISFSERTKYKSHDIWVRVLFGSLRGSVRFGSVSCTFFFYFQVQAQFGSWQNLGSGSVRSRRVRAISHLYKTPFHAVNVLIAKLGRSVKRCERIAVPKILSFLAPPRPVDATDAVDRQETFCSAKWIIAPNFVAMGQKYYRRA